MTSRKRQSRTKNELRCECRFRPLLAMWGLDYDNRPYVNIRVYKSGRLYAEVFSRHTIQITCRDCYRKHNIIIRGRSADLSYAPRNGPDAFPDAV